MRQKLGAKNYEYSESDSYISSGLATGYLCRRAEEELERIGAASGGAVTAQRLGEWMGRFLLSKSQAHQNGLDDSERVSQVRGEATERYALGAGTPPLHVRARSKRTLSTQARDSIAAAQRKRWKLAKQKQRGKQTHVHPANWGQMTKAEKQRWYYRRSHGEVTSTKSEANSRGQKTYWAKMTPAQRTAEVLRRKQVAAGKAAPRQRKGSAAVNGSNPAPRAMPRGFWQKELGRILANGPRERTDILNALTKRFPQKRDNLFVTFAYLKKKGELLETNGVFSLPKPVNGKSAEL